MTPRKPFRVGDKVHFYASLPAPLRCGAHVAEVTHVNQDGSYLEVDLGDGITRGAHPKQCRRLKPKRKPREFRIAVIRQPEGVYFKILGDNEIAAPDAEMIHVREVLK